MARGTWERPRETWNSKAEEVARQEPAPSEDTSGKERAPARSGTDEVLDNLAARFAELAARQGIRLGRGERYLYKAFADVVNASGIRLERFPSKPKGDVRDGRRYEYVNKDGEIVPMPAWLCARGVAKYFWDHPDYWAESSDPVSVFKDPGVFNECLQMTELKWMFRTSRLRTDQRLAKERAGQQPRIVTRSKVTRGE